jgi:hypothetical protein
MSASSPLKEPKEPSTFVNAGALVFAGLTAMGSGWLVIRRGVGGAQWGRAATSHQMTVYNEAIQKNLQDAAASGSPQGTGANAAAMVPFAAACAYQAGIALGNRIESFIEGKEAHV